MILRNDSSEGEERTAPKGRRLPSALRSRDGWSRLFAGEMPREPHLHQIEPTNHCPYACVMCPRSEKMTRELGFMEMELFRKVIDEVAGFSEPVRSKEIELFHFGESLLHPEIVQMVGYAAERALTVTLSVNAPDLGPDLAAEIMARGAHRIVISLDGVDEASYREIRGPAADFGKAQRHIEALIDIRKKLDSATEIVVRMIHLETNRHEILPFKWHWERRGIGVDIRTFFPWGEPDMAELGPYGTYPPGMPCPFPWQHLVVQWNGDVVPCCRDYNGENRMGNVADESLVEIWHNDLYRRLREQLRTGEYGANEVCRSCMQIYYTPVGQTGAGHPSDSAEKLLPPDVVQSSEHGRSREDLAQVWRQAVKVHGGRVYLVDDREGMTISYQDADEIIERIVDRLAAAGIGEGDKIVLWCPVHIEAVLLFWAVVQVGAVVVPLDPSLPRDGITPLLKRLRARFVLTDGSRAAQVCDGFGDVLVTDGTVAVGGQGRLFSDWLDEDRGSSAARPRLDELGLQPATVLFTSGTTGTPKGVVISHRALAHSGRLMAETYQWSSDDVLLSPGELHTMSGLRNPIVAAVAAGCATVIASTSNRASAVGIADIVHRRQVTLLAAVPAMLAQLVAVEGRLPPGALRSLRRVLTTGTFLATETRRGFKKLFGVEVLSYYGLTETTGLCAGDLIGRTPDEPPCIGKPIEALFVISDDRGRPVKGAEVGELWIQSPNLMLEYFDDSASTEAVFSGPWFRTGDFGRRRDDGSIELIGRAGDIVKGAHGEIVSCREVEHALMCLPQVADATAAVIGESIGMHGICALVVPAGEDNEDADPDVWLGDVRTDLQNRIGAKKMPTVVRMCSEIPRTATGKVPRQWLLEELGDGREPTIV